MLKAVKLRGPHLVLAYIGGDDRISLRRLANHLEHILRFNDSIRIGIPKRIFDLLLKSLDPGARLGACAFVFA